MKQREIVFALAEGQNAFFTELAEALVFELGKLGAKGSIVVGGFPPPREETVPVLMPPHEFTAVGGVHPTGTMLSRCIVISAEQPLSTFFDWNVSLARHAGGVLDINPRAVQAYRAVGIEAAHLQLGYTEAWDRRRPAAERDIDVLFVGRTTPRREKALAGYADVLERFNCEYLISDNSRPNTASTVNFKTGEDKLELLSRTKVIINVHGEDEPYFEWLRVAEAMSCGCAVVTEHSTDLEPLRVGTDVLAGRVETLALLAASLVDDEAKRSQLVASVDARLREQATLASGAAALLSVAQRVGARAIHPDAPRDITVANSAMRLNRPPEVADFHPTDIDGFSPAEQRTHRALKRQHRDVLSLRRQLSAVSLAQSRPERPRAGTVETDSTAAWRDGKEAPVVSVIVPLYNDETAVVEALESVRLSSFSSWEIVVVDDASSDGGPDAVRSWMKRNGSHPACMVRHEVNRGLSAARNTGVAQARSRLLLMLDSDNLMRRFGLARLVRAIAGDPHAAFAYGILDRFDAQGPVGLVSSFGWEPARLREGNYIDALALFRRAPFTRIGGYSADPRLLLGHEDYDLWARLAEAGEHGVFVRQFVGRYRVGHSSMLSVTNVSRTDATAAIIEHAPKLMSGVEPPG